MRIYSQLLFGVALTSILGCGDSKVASVSGTVKLDGEPLANAVVIFQPLGGGEMNPGVGSIGRKFPIRIVLQACVWPRICVALYRHAIR